MVIDINGPKVSIIMGAYNCENTIDDCINSIIKQTFTDWEFIICDDCSSDGTYDVLKNFSKRDKRIIVLHNDCNMRLSASLNKCLKIARGIYIARMDADDECVPERLSKQVEYMEIHPEIDVVGSNSIIFDETGDIGIRRVEENPSKEILLTNTPFMHPTILMKKSVYDSLGGYTVSNKTKRSQDLELWFRFYQAGYKGYNIQEPLYRYRETSDDYKKRSLKTGFNSMRLFLDGYHKVGIPKWKYVFAIKPLIAVLIPRKLMKKYHNKKASKEKK